MAPGNCAKAWPKISFCHFWTLLRYAPGAAQFNNTMLATCGGAATDDDVRPQARHD